MHSHPAGKIPLASSSKRVIFARQLGEDMTVCKVEKAGNVLCFLFL
jgi:hypothetical protein